MRVGVGTVNLEGAVLAGIVALLPGPAFHELEFTELAALAFQHGRQAALPGVGS